MPTAMVISPHADDATAFCGGTLAKLAHQGWTVILVRVTDDCKDSLGLSIDETIQKNADELRDAAKILGIREVVELGFETDMLADIPLGKLRERIVYLFRKYCPFAVFSFDPSGLYENNQDHVLVAQAVDGAKPPDQIDGVDAHDVTFGEEVLQGVQGDSVVGIVEGRNEDRPVGDIEVRIAGGQAQTLEVEWPGHGQGNDVELRAILQTGLAKARESLR